MSGQATGWVLRHGPSPTHTDTKGKPYGLARARAMRAVLLPVADAANRDGDHAHPGQAAIMEGSLYGKSQVARVLADLLAEGWLEVEQAGGGRGVATVYRVPMRPHLAPETTPPAGGTDPRNHPMGAPKPPHGGPETTPYGQSALLSTTVIPNGTTQRAPTPADLASAFETFWQAYPRKTAKGAARSAWAAATRLAGPEVITRAAARYAADPNREPEYTAHASTWLRAERWGDPPLPARSGRAGPSRLSPTNNRALTDATYQDPEVDF